jgi:hypothetical protein
MATGAGDFPMTRLLLVTAVIDCVAQVAGMGLLLLPDVVVPLWPWPTTPFTAAFLGAVYAGSFVGTVSLVLRPRWSPGRVVLPMMGLFTAVVTVVSIVDPGRFASVPRTVVWLAIYGGSAAVVAWHLWRYRGRRPAQPASELPSALRAVAIVSALILGGYGLAMLVAGAALTGSWPWPIDDFHARVYGSALLTLGVGIARLLPVATRLEVRTVGAILATSGVAAVGGLWLVDARLHRVDWMSIGTWSWIGLFGAMAGAGALLLAEARAGGHRSGDPASGQAAAWPSSEPDGGGTG